MQNFEIVNTAKTLEEIVHDVLTAHNVNAEELVRKIAEEYTEILFDENDNFYVFSWDTGIWEEERITIFIAEEILPAIRTSKNAHELKFFSSKRGIEEIAFHMKTQKAWRINSQDFDRVVDKIVVKNGVLDLNTSQVYSFDPEILATKRTPVAFCPGKRNAAFEKALSIIEKEEREWLQVFAGGGLVGKSFSDKIAVLVGAGANGKTTLANAIKAIMPSSTQISSNFFSAAEKRKDFHALKSRFVVCEELPKSNLDASTIKISTGNGVISSEQKFKNAQEIRSRATILICSNHLPSPEENGAGIERRFAIIPITKTFYAKNGAKGEKFVEPDSSLPEKLNELDAKEAILAWAAEGAKIALQLNGLLPETPAMENAHKNWVGELNAKLSPVEAFIEENFDADAADSDFVFFSPLVESFNAYAKKMGSNAITAKELEKKLADLNLEVTTRKPRKGDTLSGAGASAGAKKIYGLRYEEILTEESQKKEEMQERKEAYLKERNALIKKARINFKEENDSIDIWG